MTENLPSAPPMKPQELDQALALDAASRADWMLEELARWEEAWGLVNDTGWVIFELSNPLSQCKPWALPLWPRQELAALASRGTEETARAVPISELLDDLLPQIGERGWHVLANATPDGSGLVESPDRFGLQIREAWDEYHNDES